MSIEYLIFAIMFGIFGILWSLILVNQYSIEVLEKFFLLFVAIAFITLSILCGYQYFNRAASGPCALNWYDAEKVIISLNEKSLKIN